MKLLPALDIDMEEELHGTFKFKRLEYGQLKATQHCPDIRFNASNPKDIN